MVMFIICCCRISRSLYIIFMLSCFLLLPRYLYQCIMLHSQPQPIMNVKNVCSGHTERNSFTINTVIFSGTWKQSNVAAGLFQQATEQLLFRIWRLSALLKGISGVVGKPRERLTYLLSEIRFSELIRNSKHNRLTTWINYHHRG